MFSKSTSLHAVPWPAATVSLKAHPSPHQPPMPRGRVHTTEPKQVSSSKGSARVCACVRAHGERCTETGLELRQLSHLLTHSFHWLVLPFTTSQPAFFASSQIHSLISLVTCFPFRPSTSLPLTPEFQERIPPGHYLNLQYPVSHTTRATLGMATFRHLSILVLCFPALLASPLSHSVYSRHSADHCRRERHGSDTAPSFKAFLRLSRISRLDISEW